MRLRGAPRVAIALPPGLDFAVALHACLLARGVRGACPVRLCASPIAGDSARVRAARRSTPPAATPARQPRATRLPTAPRRTSPRRPSSCTRRGTTGAPQAVALTLGNIQANALGCAVALGHDRRERWLCPLPLSHVGGLMVLLRSAIYGTTAVLGPADT